MLINKLVLRGWMLVLLFFVSHNLNAQPCTDANAIVHITQIVNISDCNWGYFINSSAPSGWNIVQYEWNFDDGSDPVISPPTSSGVTHSFTGPGNFTVCVRMTIENAATGATCWVDECTAIQAPDCVVDCNDCTVNLAPPSVCDVDDCTKGFYIGEPQLPGNCSFVSYTWDFDDGPAETTTGPGIYHTYSNSGTYNVCVTLNATNAAGQPCSSQICTQVVVTGCGTPPDPCIDCNASVEVPSMTSISNCQKAFSTNSFINATACTLVDYTWDMGDGTILQNQTNNVIHNYTSSNTFDVCVTANLLAADGSSCEVTACTTIVVTGCTDPCDECNATVSVPSVASIGNCLRGFSTSSQVTNPCTLIDYTWDMGDGTILQNQNSNLWYEYSSSGPMNVCVTARVEAADGSICEVQACTTIVITGCTLCNSDNFEPNGSTGQATPPPAGNGGFSYSELCLSQGDIDFFLGGSNNEYLIQVVPGPTNAYGKYNLRFDPKVNTDCITVQTSPFANSQTDTYVRLFDNSSVNLNLLAQDDNSGQNLFSLIEYDCGPMKPGRKMQGLQKVSVYPNPVGIGERLQLDLPEHIHTLEFRDLQGKIVWSQEVNPQQSIALPEHLSEGVYLIHTPQGGIDPIRLSVQNR